MSLPRETVTLPGSGLVFINDYGDGVTDPYRAAVVTAENFLLSFAQPNFYYWGIAIGMKLFGTDLFGLRSFVAICGTLMFVPFYPLVRLMFGVRTALIAMFLLAVSDVNMVCRRARSP